MKKETKLCKACLEEKELCEFGRDSYFEDGYRSKCKMCQKNKVPILKENNVKYKICSICNKENNASFFVKDCVESGVKIIKCKSCKNIENKKLTQINKVCTLCDTTKDQIYFSKDKHSSDGYSSACLDCRQNKVRIVEEDISKGFKTCTKCNILKPLDCYGKDKYGKYGLSARCKNCINEYNNTPNQKLKRKKYRDVTKDFMKVYLKEYNLINNNKLTERKKQYYRENKKNINDFKREWSKNKAKVNPLFKLTLNIRANILDGIKRSGNNKYKNTHAILGCTFEEFKKHIESQFESWMNWGNYGNACETLQPNCSWDLDHIIPISYAKTEEEVYLLNHWSNFQPLCSLKNRNIKKNNVHDCSNIELGITFKR